MLIALTRDEPTVKTIRILKEQFPNEVAQTIEQIQLYAYDLSHIEEKPITSITVLGHTDDQIYGGMDSKHFADLLMQIFKINDEISPGFSAQLQTIDLLGCELGFVGSQNSSFAFAVANHLQNQGYPIEIRAFTPPKSTNNQFSNTLLHRNTHENTLSWAFYGFKTAEDAENYSHCLEERKTITQIRRKKHSETYILIENLRALDPKKDKKQYDLLLQQQEKIQQELDFLTNQRAELTQIMRDCSVEIAATTNHKAYFDQHPECNFTALAHQETKEKLHTQLQTLQENSQNLEVQNNQWQHSLEKARAKIIQEKSKARTPEEETVFKVQLEEWKQEFQERKSQIKMNQVTIQELAEQQQNLLNQIAKLDHQDKRTTKHIVRQYRDTLKKEKVGPDQHPLTNQDKHPRH